MIQFAIIFQLNIFFVTFLFAVATIQFSTWCIQCNFILCVRVINTCMIGVAPAASSGSACRMDRKVSQPSKPRPDRKAPMTGITDSSRSSQRTKPCRYCSLNTLRNMQQLSSSSAATTVQLQL